MKNESVQELRELTAAELTLVGGGAGGRPLPEFQIFPTPHVLFGTGAIPSERVITRGHPIVVGIFHL